MPTSAETLAFARQAHQAGDLAGAASLYRQVLKAEPANFEALVLLGLACHQGGHVAEAERCYRQALDLRPADADLHFKLALVLQTLGRSDEAAACFRKVISLRPESAEAWNNLGNVSFLQSRTEEAIACYEEAVRLRPGYAEACLNLGVALREDDRLSEGLAWYREAVRLKPAYPKAHNNLGVALIELGDREGAETHFRECLRHSPGSVLTLYNVAANGLYADSDPGPEQLRARLGDSRLSPLEVSQLHFTIALLLDKAGAYDEAFPHFHEGNRLRREQLRQAGAAFDPDVHSELVDRLVKTFSPEYFEQVRNLGVESDTPVFIVGMPRSGSSLVEQILSHHPAVAGVGELRDLPRMVIALPARLGGDAPYPECVLRLDAATTRELADNYLARIRRLAGPAQRITDKMLENALHLGLIATLFPRSRVIHCRRDPLDVCLSCYLQFFLGLDFTWDLGDLGRYHKDYERLMIHWRTTLPLPLLDVGYEELVADIEGISRRLVDFCGLPWDERCLRFHENPRAVRTMSKLQIRQPIYGSSVGRWQRYAAHLDPLREALGVSRH